MLFNYTSKDCIHKKQYKNDINKVILLLFTFTSFKYITLNNKFNKNKTQVRNRFKKIVNKRTT